MMARAYAGTSGGSMNRGLTDKEFKAERARVEKLTIHWRNWLGLDWWKVDVHYDAVGDIAISHSDTGASMATISLMDCVAEWEYLLLSIRVNLLETHNLNDADLENAVVHELCHALVSEMRVWENTETGRKHEERVVVHLARAFVWVAENAAKEAGKKQKAVA